MGLVDASLFVPLLMRYDHFFDYVVRLLLQSLQPEAELPALKRDNHFTQAGKWQLAVHACLPLAVVDMAQQIPLDIKLGRTDRVSVRLDEGHADIHQLGGVGVRALEAEGNRVFDDLLRILVILRVDGVDAVAVVGVDVRVAGLSQVGLQREKLLLEGIVVVKGEGQVAAAH